jgi:hypothetical protein
LAASGKIATQEAHMTRYMATVVMVGLASAFWATTPVAAQQVSSFEQLQLLVKPGDTILVTDGAGATTKGKIESLTPESLRLSVKKTVREFSRGDTRLIRQWRQDSLGNGALIGAVSGAGFGVFMAIMCGIGEGGCGNGTSALLIGMFTGAGTGVGVGVDALIISRHTLYKSPGTAGLDRFRVKPLISGDRKGAAVSFSF